MQSKKNTFISIVIFIIIIIILEHAGFLRPIEKVSRRAINASSSFVYKFGNRVKGKSYIFTDKKNLEKAYKNLQEECETHTIDKASYKMLEEENKGLREQLDFFDRDNFKHAGAEVIGRNIDPLETTLVLNKGTESGIKVNNPVIAGNGSMIGKITRAEHETSIVRLINDVQSRVIATIINMNKSIGVVEGGYGITVHMNFIPQNEVVNPGDIVVTSGLEEGIPHGLVIGTIEVIEKNIQEPFQEAVLQPATDLNKIRLVSVIID